MNWYYFLHDGKDRIEQKPEGYYLARDDLLLGPANKDVERLLFAKGFSPANIKRLILKMGSNRRDEFAPKTTEGEQEMAERRPCPECGKNLTWVADGSRPRQHKCEPPPGFVPGQQEEAPPPAEEQAQPKPGALNPATVMAKYIANRDQIAAEKKIFDEKVALLKTQQKAIETWLGGKLDSMGITSMKQNDVGVAFFKTKSSATVADAQQFIDWVLDDWDARNHFLERRVSKVAVDEWVGEGNTLPAGTNYTTVRVVQVNRG